MSHLFHSPFHTDSVPEDPAAYRSRWPPACKKRSYIRKQNREGLLALLDTFIVIVRLCILIAAIYNICVFVYHQLVSIQGFIVWLVFHLSEVIPHVFVSYQITILSFVL